MPESCGTGRQSAAAADNWCRTPAHHCTIARQQARRRRGGQRGTICERTSRMGYAVGAGRELPGSELLHAAQRSGHRRRSVRRVVARRKKNLIFLDPEQLWAFEAADRLTFVHPPEGRFAIDLSL